MRVWRARIAARMNRVHQAALKLKRHGDARSAKSADARATANKEAS